MHAQQRKQVVELEGIGIFVCQKIEEIFADHRITIPNFTAINTTHYITSLVTGVYY